MPDSPSNDASSRRRTVAATPVRRPFALIGLAADARRAVVLDYGPCVVFPSITHFRAAPRERWAGVLVTRASAWEPVLDSLVRDRECVALMEVTLTHEWPDDVVRLSDEAQLRAWLAACHAVPARGPLPIASQRAKASQARAAEVREPRDERAARAVRNDVDDSEDERVESDGEPTARETRAYLRPRSELLVIARTVAMRSALFRLLRGARPVRVLSAVSEIPAQDRDAQRFVGVVVADDEVSDASIAPMVRASCVVSRLDPRAPLDEQALKHWLLRAVAYEYTGHAVVADVIAEAFARADEAAYMQSVEVAALYACALAPHQRSTALDMTGHTWRWYAKESARILGVSSKALAQRALNAAGLDAPLAPSPWLASEALPESNLWTSLRTRIPSDVRSAPLSRVPWSEGKVADVSRACAEHGLRRVDDLLTHDLTLLGAHWANARTCDVLQDAFLSTLPYTASCLPDEATSFALALEALIASMPSENEARPLRVASGWARVPGATSRALRFHEPFLTQLRTKLEQLLVSPATLAQLRERDPFLSDLPSISELEHFARTALRLSLHVFMNAEGESVIAKERPPKVSERALAPVARTTLGDARASLATAVPVHVQDGLVVAEQALTREGAPMSRGDLANKLGAAAQDTFYRMVARRPFVELDARSWGLIERDVPGGDRAFSAAIAMLRTRFPLTAPINDEVVEAVRLLSDAHRGWTRETIVTAIRCARASEIDV